LFFSFVLAENNGNEQYRGLISPLERRHQLLPCITQATSPLGPVCFLVLNPKIKGFKGDQLLSRIKGYNNAPLRKQEQPPASSSNTNPVQQQ
jgi:hypothetical protein